MIFLKTEKDKGEMLIKIRNNASPKNKSNMTNSLFTRFTKLYLGISLKIENIKIFYFNISILLLKRSTLLFCLF